MKWIFASPQRVITIGLILALLFGFFWVAWPYIGNSRAMPFLVWSRGDSQEIAELITVQRAACPGAPFTLPADGFIGLKYGDPRGPYSKARPHQGIDIFSQDRDVPGKTPVYAAFDGYVTREDNWQSSLIQRVPQDPLLPGRQIWLYYTHMADREGNDFIEDLFPKGSQEVFVEQGTLLGYTGDYNGGSARDIWVHLHFSIVLDDGFGNYRNELLFANTMDPSPYFGMPLNDKCQVVVPSCSSNPVCR